MAIFFLQVTLKSKLTVNSSPRSYTEHYQKTNKSKRLKLRVQEALKSSRGFKNPRDQSVLLSSSVLLRALCSPGITTNQVPQRSGLGSAPGAASQTGGTKAGIITVKHDRTAVWWYFQEVTEDVPTSLSVKFGF